MGFVDFSSFLLVFIIFLFVEMATTQLTASTISAKGFVSFEGLRASSNSVKVSSFAPLGQNALSKRAFRGLVVKAATTVAPKVF